MVDVIDFLERMGRDAELRHASDAVLERAMREAQMDALTRTALMSGDRVDIEAALGAKTNVCCAIFTPGDEEPPPQGVERRKAA